MANYGDYSLTQSAGLVGVSKLINVLGLLVASMILTRLLSRSEYGNYEQVWLVYNSFLPLVGTSLSSSVYYFSARPERTRTYGSGVLATAIVGLIFGAALAVLAPSISHWFGSNELTGYLQIFAVYAVLSSPSLIFESVFVTERKVGLLLGANAALSIMFAGGVLISGFVFHNLTAVFISVAVVGAAKSIFLLQYLFRKKPGLHRGSGFLRSQIIYALPIFVSGMVGTLSKQVDRYLVSIFFSPDKFALYSIGSKEVPLIAIVTGSASAVLFPVFSELGAEDGRGKFLELWRNSMAKTGLFLLPIMVFLLFAAKDFMVFFFGAKYGASAVIFRIFLLLLPMRLAFYSQALLSLGKQRLYMYSSIAEAVLSGVVSYIMLRSFGMEGAAVGKVVVSYAEVVFLVGVLLVLLRSKITTFFPWARLSKIVLISAIGIVPLFFVRNWLDNVYIRFLTEGVVFTTVFGAIAIAAGLVRVVDLKRMQFIVN